MFHLKKLSDSLKPRDILRSTMIHSSRPMYNGISYLSRDTLRVVRVKLLAGRARRTARGARPVGATALRVCACGTAGRTTG